MAAALADIKQGKKIRRLPRGGQHGRRPALKLRNLCRHVVVGGVLQSGIKVARSLQIKKLSHILAGGVFESG